MLYTRKGDDGTTKTFGAKERISKGSVLAEALGTLDEINSFLGICKIKSEPHTLTLGDTGVLLHTCIHDVQMDLFIVQAEVAGADKSIPEDKVKKLERYTDAIEKELPPITTFFVSGGTELAAFFDTARTIARRAERRIVALQNEDPRLSDHTLAYVNRLSSLLYACARLCNHKSGINEVAPTYK